MLTMEHIGICAKDTMRLKDWYVKVFDFKIVYDNKKEKPTYFLLMEDENMIEIYPMEHAVAPKDTKKYQGIRHIAFGTDQIEKEYENLLKNDVEIIEELTTSSKGIKTAWFKDLEGNIMHFIQRPEPLY
ncbi:VOC family protein [Marinisporobacter balticus]|uniref:Glyoxalase/bleomycin resistance protein/dioxygenase superfamily protein n=1 Tax=Marinisporobacter balticus TaxID=2018667 RepID=A0A4R2KS02_9FIRM|nr:VOC family protein [Marinisporobacter balticus]TCO76494.1 glyoxalase/bleomycin resistance protein/dioxygenase superfamily protein [Marinisporobacter balticus]